MKEKIKPSIFTGLRKALKMIKCQIDNNIRIIIIEAAVEVEIRKCEIISGIHFEIGNEESPNWTFAKLTIAECVYYLSEVQIEAFNYRSVASIHLLDSIMEGTHIKDIAHDGTIGYIIENCTFILRWFAMESFDADYVRITDSKFTRYSDAKEGFILYVDIQNFDYDSAELMINLSNLSNPSYEGHMFAWIAVHVDNCEFIGSEGIGPGGVIRVEGINLNITNSVFRMTEHSDPPQTGGFIFISGANWFEAVNVTFNARKLTGQTRVSIMTTRTGIVHITFNDTEILCPTGMKAVENEINYVRHYTCLLACPHGEYTYESGTVLLSGYSSVKSPPKSLVEENIFPYCHPCPVGADCSRSTNVKALPNYWGYVNNNTVKMNRCPNGYCCQDNNACKTLDSCNRHRSGVLCGSCEKNWTESLFSEKCISKEGCNSRLIIGLYILVVIGYSFGLITFNTLKDQFLKFLKLLYKKIQNKIFKKNSSHKCKEKDSENIEKEEGDDTMKYIQILLYYVQDASLFKITLPSDGQSHDGVIIKIVKFSPDIISDLYTYMSNICFETGSTPGMKILFKSMLGPCIMTFLLLLYCIQAIMAKYIFAHSKFWKSFKVCLVRAFLLSVLFSYQQLLIAAFILIQCIEIFGNMVLFVQAEIQCLTMWQQVLQVFLYLNILPTFLVLSHASFYVAENKMSSGIFILTCLFPIPTIIIYHFAKCFHPVNPEEPADLEMRKFALCYRV